MSDVSSTANTGIEGAQAMGDDLELDLGPTAEDMIRQRILHALGIYPKLSPSMLQIGIGTGFPPALWHPVLEKMIANGEVVRTQVQATNPVSKRDQTYTILQLAPTAGESGSTG